MTALEVVTAGATTTLQDGGRVGAARWGVPRSGPVDALAHRLAARLAGATGTEVAATPTIEVGPHPSVLAAVDGPVTVALAGPGAVLVVGDVELAAPVVVTLAPGEEATVRAHTWAYVAVAARLEVPTVLGSSSRHPRSGLGPALEDGTQLHCTAPRPVRTGRYREPALPGGPLLVLPAPQTHLFTPEARAELVEATFTTTADVDRMGMRLSGPVLAAHGGHDIVSDGIVAGALQVPGDGQPYVLLADHQTTGGYPKVAVLTPVDLVRCTRLRPGAPMRFAWTDVAAARVRLQDAVDAVEAVVAAPARPHARDLAARNLIGGVTDPTTDPA